MLWLAVCLAVGILFAKFVSVGIVPALIAAAAFALLAPIFRTKAAATVFISLAFVSAGAVSFHFELQQNTASRLKTLYDSGTIRSGSPVEIEGILIGRPEPAVEGDFLNLRSSSLHHKNDHKTVTGNVRLFVPKRPDHDLKSEISNLKYGSRIRTACNLEREDEYLNPGVLPKREILDRLGIDATCSIKSSLLVEAHRR